jgi:hypothetical protein
MPGALNKFQTTLANVTTTTANVYTPPTGYATVVLMAQVSNGGNSTIQITANVNRGGNSTSLVNGATCPPADAISLLTGRLILNVGDVFQIKSTDNTSGQLVFSYLETLVTGS